MITGLPICTTLCLFLHTYSVCQTRQPFYEGKSWRAHPNFADEKTEAQGGYGAGTRSLSQALLASRSAEPWSEALCTSANKHIGCTTFRYSSDVLYHSVFTMALRKRYRYSLAPLFVSSLYATSLLQKTYISICFR